MVSERKQPHFCVRVLLTSSRSGEGSGRVSFYERSSCSPCQDKASLSYPQCPGMEGERRQAVPRETLSREQAGDSSRPAGPGMAGGTPPFWSRRLMSPGHKGDEKNQQEPKGPPEGREAQRHAAGRFVKGKAVTPGLPSCGRVTNCPHLSGTKGTQGMQGFRC